MPLLPEGFALPPLPYLVGLLGGLAAVIWLLYLRRPAVTERHVLALAPWMAFGSCLHVLFVVGLLPAAVEPFAGTPAVYLSAALLAGASWLGAELSSTPRESIPAVLAITGTIALIPVVAVAVLHASRVGTLQLFWPAIALISAIPLSWAAWIVTTRLAPTASMTGWVGVLTIFGHGLDGVSTAVGIDILGYGERTPLSRWIMEAAAGLPGELGGGWVFLLVKLVLAGGITALFGEYVEEDPVEGYLLLGFIAAVGLGPGAHNLLLFAITG